MENNKLLSLLDFFRLKRTESQHFLLFLWLIIKSAILYNQLEAVKATNRSPMANDLQAESYLGGSDK